MSKIWHNKFRGIKLVNYLGNKINPCQASYNMDSISQLQKKNMW